MTLIAHAVAMPMVVASRRENIFRTLLRLTMIIAKQGGRAVVCPSLLITCTLLRSDHLFNSLAVVAVITGCEGHAAQNFAGLG
jgi:hypothetical protein